MRLRHKPWAQDMLRAHPEYVVQAGLEDKQDFIDWTDIFSKDQPLHIEVGMGKGEFITEMARRNPNINYIGIELQDSVTVVALERLLKGKEQLDNIKLFPMHGGDVDVYFAPESVDRIYLNFSDPWPKTRHAKRRLTHKRFLEGYEKVIVEDGELHFKTDNQGLFEYSLVSFSEYGMRLKEVWLNLHESEFHEQENVMTEYEQNFSSRGYRIYRLEAKFPVN